MQGSPLADILRTGDIMTSEQGFPWGFPNYSVVLIDEWAKWQSQMI